MSNTALTMYDLGIDEIVDLIRAVGHETTVLAEGHMGTGKSSMLNTLAALLPTHKALYFRLHDQGLG